MKITALKPVIVDKPWGSETWICNNEAEDYCSKLLYIKKGHSTHMHFHIAKHETFYVISGQLFLSHLDTSNAETIDRVIFKGETVEIPRGLPHKLEAQGSDVELIETSTYHRDSDSYRIGKICQNALDGCPVEAIDND